MSDSEDDIWHYKSLSRCKKSNSGLSSISKESIKLKHKIKTKLKPPNKSVNRLKTANTASSSESTKAKEKNHLKSVSCKPTNTICEIVRDSQQFSIKFKKNKAMKTTTQIPKLSMGYSTEGAQKSVIVSENNKFIDKNNDENIEILSIKDNLEETRECGPSNPLLCNSNDLFNETVQYYLQVEEETCGTPVTNPTEDFLSVIDLTPEVYSQSDNLLCELDNQIVNETGDATGENVESPNRSELVIESVRSLANISDTFNNEENNAATVGQDLLLDINPNFTIITKKESANRKITKQNAPVVQLASLSCINNGDVCTETNGEKCNAMNEIMNDSWDEAFEEYMIDNVSNGNERNNPNSTIDLSTLPRLQSDFDAKPTSKIGELSSVDYFSKGLSPQACTTNTFKSSPSKSKTKSTSKLKLNKTNSIGTSQTTLFNYFNVVSTKKSDKIDTLRKNPDIGVNSTINNSNGGMISTNKFSKFTKKSAIHPPVCNESLNEQTASNKRSCPFYKWITGTNITVDAFCYGKIQGCEAYFLSHFHYDHYRGLKKSFNQPIYCSKVTGKLLQTRLKVDEKYIHCLPMDTPQIVEGVTVTLIDANHCPGSVMFVFRLRSGRTFLHTGDFRAHPSMQSHHLLQLHLIHKIYLDTTYCDPQYKFPPQEEVISLVIETTLNFLKENPRTLIVCGTYTIGKERVFIGIADVLDCTIAVTKDKKSILDCLDDYTLSKRLTTDIQSTRLHVVPMNFLNFKKLHEYRSKFGGQYTNILAFEPTGWSYSGTQKSMTVKMSKDGITIYGVPYSEHSSYDELKWFVKHLRCKNILPTVNNGSKASRDRMQAEFTDWLLES